MKNYFCNYENSLLLRELGYDEECIAIHIGGNVFMGVYGRKNSIQDVNYPTAPLLSQAIQWIRDNTDFIIGTGNAAVNENNWVYEILAIRGKKFCRFSGEYDTWNQCAQDAITETLKIIKDRNAKT